MRLEPAVRVAHHPHALFGALDAGFAIQTQLVLHVEAGPAERDGALDRHIITESRWPQESRPRVHKRETAEFELLEHFEFGQSEPPLKQQRGRGIEDLEVAWIEDTSGGIAITPFGPHFAGIAECSHCDLVSAWRHAQRAVEADYLAVEIGVVDAVKHERRKLARLA